MQLFSKSRRPTPRKLRNILIVGGLLLLGGILLTVTMEATAPRQPANPTTPPPSWEILTITPLPMATPTAPAPSEAGNEAETGQTLLEGLNNAERACLPGDVATDAALREAPYAEIEHCLSLRSTTALFLSMIHDKMPEESESEASARRCVGAAFEHVNRLEKGRQRETNLAGAVGNMLSASTAAENVFIHCVTVTERQELTDRTPDAAARQRSSCIIERSGGLNAYLTAVVANDGNLTATEDHCE